MKGGRLAVTIAGIGAGTVVVLAGMIVGAVWATAWIVGGPQPAAKFDPSVEVPR